MDLHRLPILSLLAFGAVAAFEPPVPAVPDAVNLPACTGTQPSVKVIRTTADLQDLNNPSFRVFCVEPGDYRSFGPIDLTADGTAAVPRVIRASGVNQRPWELVDSARVVLPPLRLRDADNWIVSGIAFRNGAGRRLFEVREDSDNVKAVGLLIEDCDGSCAYWGTGSDNGLLQGSVLRRTGAFVAEERAMLTISASAESTVATQELGVRALRIIGNEFSDAAGDDIQVWVSDKESPLGDTRGLMIVDNDFYVTASMYTDAAGNPSSTGEWSCSENAIDFKIGVSGDNVAAGEGIVVSDNRMWGFRKTSTLACPGLSSHAFAIIAHKSESDYISIERNVIFDTVNGVMIQGPADHATIRNNLFSNVANVEGARAALELTGAGQIQARGNTIANTGTYLKAGGSQVDFSDNTIVNGGTWSTTNGLDFVNSTVGANRYYGDTDVYDGAADIAGNSVQAQSLDSTYCLTVQKLTAPRIVCIDGVEDIDSVTTSRPSPPDNLLVGL